MEEPDSPYEGGNPYASEEMTAGTSAGGGSGAGVIPVSTKPRQEPAGSKPPDPEKMMQQMQTAMPMAPAAPGMGAAPPAMGQPPAAPGLSPGMAARRSDAMVRYIIDNNPGISPITARMMVYAADYTGPTRMGPQVIQPGHYTDPIQQGLEKGVGLTHEYNDHLYNQHERATKGMPPPPGQDPAKSPLREFVKDRIKQQVNPNHLRNKQRDQKRWDQASPEQHINRLHELFQGHTRGMDPNHPDYRQAEELLHRGLGEQQRRIQEAANQHNSEAYRTHRTWKETGAIPPGHADNNFAHFYHNNFALNSPHKWQHLWGLPHEQHARQWQMNERRKRGF